jgi:hypothetical protein
VALQEQGDAGVKAMDGIMVVLEPDGTVKQQKFAHTPELEAIRKEIGGGHLQKVHGFNLFRFKGENYRCLALCDPDGKNKGMRTNIGATRAWHAALRARGHQGLVALREFPGSCDNKRVVAFAIFWLSAVNRRLSSARSSIFRVIHS